MMRLNFFRAIFLLILGLVATAPAQAQEYVIEAGDKVLVSIWQAPEVPDQEAVVDGDGRIDLPILGRVLAAGLTISQLESKIVENFRNYNRNITQAQVKVVEYGSKKIFVTGAVRLPGAVSFPQMPNVWEAILEAGGPLDEAELEKVTIVRKSGTQGQVIAANLVSYFDAQDISNLPELRPGDTIHVPGGTGNGVNGPNSGAGGGLFTKSQAIYIYGEVLQPGRYELQESLDVLQAIVLAGGPAAVEDGNTRGPSIRPDLKRVRIITRTPEGAVVYKVNLHQYAKIGVPIPITLKPGDTIYVPRKESYLKFFTTNTLRTVVTSTASLFVSFIVFDQIFNANGNNNNNNNNQ